MCIAIAVFTLCVVLKTQNNPVTRHILANLVTRSYADVTSAPSSSMKQGTHYAMTTPSASETTTTTTTSSYLISKGTDICSPLRGYNNTLTLVAVLSATARYEHRSAVRGTWGGVLSSMPGFRVLFMLGRPSNDTDQNRIVEEDAEHDDIVQGNFFDTYQNLTLKSVMMLRWVHRFCPNAKFVLKIDDDVLLNVWDFAVTLCHLSYTAPRLTIWGKLRSSSRPSRKKKGRYAKWYVPKWMYPNETYPDYVNGPAYLISGDSVPLLLGTASTVPYFFIEDVYITGMVAVKAGVRLENDSGYASSRKRGIRPCQKPRVVASHGWSPRDLRLAWTEMAGKVNRRRCRSLGLKV
ncbi:hypothetical protein HPB50_017104 [Hyalomma asiaticum]|uniref:Uncharacterized protein n=1 Tax=Hyalomma asiaticum TaxID=266040 RepID=A0ACB7T342_HYAAI|nr:hypothetical protein HPB50_017104 [Hyalomma asiaticum]